MDRIVPKTYFSEEQISSILTYFGLQQLAPAVPMGGGRIASNLLVSSDRGSMVIRSYPSSYGSAKARFESEILSYLSQKGCKVPSPLPLIRPNTKNQKLLSIYDKEVFLYEILLGTSLQQSELSTSVAAAAGRSLATIATVGMSFEAPPLSPHGDIEFITLLLRQAKLTDPILANHAIAERMMAAVTNKDLAHALEATSKGIVHADYFFENVLMDSSRKSVTGIIDFGDAYYGFVLSDVVIGAMEFSVSENEEWNLDSWSAFLEENQTWLKHQSFPPSLAIELLLANCVRFALYTLPSTYVEGLPLDENKYVKRFIKIKHTDLGTQLQKKWEKVVQASS